MGTPYLPRGMRRRLCAGAGPSYPSGMLDPRPEVLGVQLDAQTRCAHYRSPLDVVAIRMKCCGAYYACKDCHDAVAGHGHPGPPRGEWDHPAVLCGVCGTQMSVRDYLASGYRCPACESPFNPGCRAHHHFYFET